MEFRGIVWSGDVLFGAGGAEWGTVLSLFGEVWHGITRYCAASRSLVL